MPTLWRDVPFSALYWSGYEFIKHRMSLNTPGSSSSSSALSAEPSAKPTLTRLLTRCRRQAAAICTLYRWSCGRNHGRRAHQSHRCSQDSKANVSSSQGWRGPDHDARDSQGCTTRRRSARPHQGHRASCLQGGSCVCHHDLVLRAV